MKPQRAYPDKEQGEAKDCDLPLSFIGLRQNYAAVSVEAFSESFVFSGT